MRTIKTYSRRAPFYNAFLGTNPGGITSESPVIRPESMPSGEITACKPTSHY
jgi:hypothetical protein